MSIDALMSWVKADIDLTKCPDGYEAFWLIVSLVDGEVKVTTKRHPRASSAAAAHVGHGPLKFIPETLRRRDGA